MRPFVFPSELQILLSWLSLRDLCVCLTVLDQTRSEIRVPDKNKGSRITFSIARVSCSDLKRFASLTQSRFSPSKFTQADPRAQQHLTRLRQR